MTAAVLDAWAVLAFLRREGPAARMVRLYLQRAHAGNLRLLLSLINLGEIYYRVFQSSGENKAEEALELLRRLPIQLVLVKEAMVLEAARLKAVHRISHADSFAVATARLHRGGVLTGDPEILALPKSVVKVRRLER